MDAVLVMVRSAMYVAVAAAAKAHNLSAVEAQIAYESVDRNTDLPNSVEEAWYFLDDLFAHAQH